MREDIGAHQAILVRVYRRLLRVVGSAGAWCLFLDCPPLSLLDSGEVLGSRVCNYWVNISPSWETWHPESFIPMWLNSECFCLQELRFELIWQIRIRKQCSEGMASFIGIVHLREAKHCVRVIPSPSSCLCERKDKQQHFLVLWWQNTSNWFLNKLWWIKSQEFLILVVFLFL